MTMVFISPNRGHHVLLNLCSSQPWAEQCIQISVLLNKDSDIIRWSLDHSLCLSWPLLSLKCSWFLRKTKTKTKTKIFEYIFTILGSWENKQAENSGKVCSRWSRKIIEFYKYLCKNRPLWLAIRNYLGGPLPPTLNAIETWWKLHQNM